MCLKCHSSPRQAMEEWKREVEEFEKGNHLFHKANTTHILFMIYSMCGHDIDPDDETVMLKSKTYATEVFNNYLAWYQQNKEDRYFPETGMETMFSRKALHDVAKYIQDNQGMEQMEMINGCSEILEKDQKSDGKHIGQIIAERKKTRQMVDIFVYSMIAVACIIFFLRFTGLYQPKI